MCGIAGWTDYRRDVSREDEVINRLKETLYNRGPDAGGMLLARHAALGHRRLSVVDPEGGAQPMTRSRGEHTYTIIYNGELYNTEDIRRDLIACGHEFQGHSDTEVLLCAYIQWGAGCLEKLNGIFAFAVWEEPGEKLFLARDRMGVKPLFYTEKNGLFLFGSELKALLAHPDVQQIGRAHV